MKDNNEASKGKKPVKYTTVDWDKYKVDKENKEAAKKTDKRDWQVPEIGEKWAVGKASGGKEKYDFAADKELNEALKKADVSKSDGEAVAGKHEAGRDKQNEDRPLRDKDMKELSAPQKEQDDKAPADAGNAGKQEESKKQRKRKSLNTKLGEMGSNWVTTGNFRNSETIDDKTIKDLENNIIEATKGSQDELLKSAVKEVSKALKDDEGYEPLGEVSLGDTFEIPKLDIHFGDTADLSEVKKDVKELEAKDLKEAIEKLDLAASIEEQTAKEIAERDEVDKVVEALRNEKRRKKKRPDDGPASGDEAEASGSRRSKKKRTQEGVEELKTAGKSPKKRSTQEDIGEPESGSRTSRKKRNAEEGPAEETALKKKNSKRRKEAGAEENAEELPARKRTSKKRAGSQAADDDKVIIQSDELKKKGKKSSSGKRTSSKDTSSEDAPSKKKTSKTSSSKRTASKRSSSDSDPAGRSSGKRKKSTGSRSRSEAAGKSGIKQTGDKDTDKKRTDGRNEPSEFRKRSADWKDEQTIEKAARISDFKRRKEELYGRIKKITPVQWTMVAMALVIFITGIMTSAVYANYQGEQNKVMALKSLERYTEDESYAAAVEKVTEEMLPQATDEPEPVQARALSLEMSSVEKDLKIKLVDEEDTLVKDVSWSVTVATESDDSDGEGDAGTVYEDDDRDGIIYITDISAGDYAVTLNPSDSLADYILPQEKQLVSVKASIEYKVIANIRDEIKSEKEVNVALEDPNGNQAADVETGPAIVDTVEWVESTKTASGEEEYVEATPDISKTASSVKKDKGFLTAFKYIGKNAKNVFARNSVLGISTTPGYTVATEVLDPDPEPTPTPTPTPTPEPLSEEQTDPKISIKSDKDSVTVGSSIELSASYEPSDFKVKWEIDDIAKASIEVFEDNKKCKITGVKEGDINVTATCFNDDGSKSASTTKKITVKADNGDETLSISGSSSVIVGSTVQLTASYKPDTAKITSWETSDSEVASISVSDDGKTCTVKGEKEGSVTITVKCDNGKSTTMTVTVKTSDGNYSDDAKLYDASKNPLYVKDGDNYRLATYGDYRGGIFTTYYRRQDRYLYTGWQTIDGRTYYYRSDHTYVTGEQIIQGIKYSFGDDGALATGSGTLGIDVSKYQPSINWSSVKASGVNFVIIRCGYRGASTGALIQDPYFTSHIKGAKAAGLKVGVYFFTTALTEAEAVEEASMCAALCSGYGINYPIFMDCENSPRPGYNSMSASERTAVIKAFCNTIKSAGYTPGVYANKTWLSSYINTSSLSGCRIWLAQYNAAGPTYTGRYDIWQYTSKGHVDGISGNVDMNQSYMGY